MSSILDALKDSPNPIRDYVATLDMKEIQEVISEWEKYEETGQLDPNGRLAYHTSAVVNLTTKNFHMYKVWIDKLMIEVFRELANHYKDLWENQRAM